MAKLLSKNASERNGVAKTCILLVPDNNFFPFFVIYGTQFVKIPPQMKMHFEVIARIKKLLYRDIWPKAPDFYPS